MTTATFDPTTVKADKIVDARGSACPGPLLEAKKGIGNIKRGEILEIWSGDPKTQDYVAKWAKKTGHEFLGAVSQAGYDRIFVVRRK